MEIRGGAVEHFDAPWDAGLKGITAGVLLVCALAIAGAVAVGVRVASPAAGTAGGIALSVVIGVLPFPAMLILFAAFREAPRGYAVGPGGVTVERRAHVVTIPFVSIREVAMLDPKVFLRRVGGVGGFFGYFGLYQAEGLGRVSLYATRSDARVLLATDSGSVVVTPAEPERFVAAVRARLGRPA
jgi:hypothetical protein